jgi:O-6-methylguanine DNA methyltransferase
MGQRDNSPKSNQQMSIFLTDLGWMGISGTAHRVQRLRFGHHSDEEVRDALLDHQSHNGETFPKNSDWFPDLRRRLQRYGQGEYVDFADVELLLPKLTAFQEAVMYAVRAVGYGHTVSYAELAELAGYPRAARAVGTVMSSNPLPILVPCHRVVGSGGKLGGYSAPQGLSLKQDLLAMEAETVQTNQLRL